jgi:SOS response regulatory protein OraA/RecX
MKLDTVFLTEYIEHEIYRLEKVIKNERNNLGIAQSEIEAYLIYEASPKKIQQSRQRVQEAKTKLNIVEPRVEKLKEQLAILSK